jgi:hypothetical protein
VSQASACDTDGSLDVTLCRSMDHDGCAQLQALAGGESTAKPATHPSAAAATLTHHERLPT